MSGSADLEQVHDSFQYGVLGFGALATASPGAITGIYGLQDTGSVRVAVRMWGIVSTAQALNALRAGDDEQRRLNLQVGAAVSLGNVATQVVTRGDASARSRVLIGLSAGGFLVAALWGLSQG